MAMRPPFIVMLDLDGPVCTGRAHHGTGDWFDPVAGGMLARFCRDAGARIVIISARRRDDGLRGALHRIGLAVHLFEDPDHWRTGHDPQGIRGNEVDAWHGANPGHAYAIVDDERGGYAPRHLARLVHTGLHAGLQMRDVMLLRRYAGIADDRDVDQADLQHPRLTLAATAELAAAALDQGDDQATRDLLAVIAAHPLAQ